MPTRYSTLAIPCHRLVVADRCSRPHHYRNHSPSPFTTPGPRLRIHAAKARDNSRCNPRRPLLVVISACYQSRCRRLQQAAHPPESPPLPPRSKRHRHPARQRTTTEPWGPWRRCGGSIGKVWTGNRRLRSWTRPGGHGGVPNPAEGLGIRAVRSYGIRSKSI